MGYPQGGPHGGPQTSHPSQPPAHHPHPQGGYPQTRQPPPGGAPLSDPHSQYGDPYGSYYGRPPRPVGPPSDPQAKYKLIAILAIAGAIGLAVILKLAGSVSSFGGVQTPVPNDKNLTLMLISSAWNDTVNGQKFGLRFDASGQFDIVTFDAAVEEEVAARGSWMVKDGNIQYSIHYSDDEEWIRSGPYVEKVITYGDGPNDTILFQYERVSGDGGIVGAPSEGVHKPGH